MSPPRSKRNASDDRQGDLYSVQKSDRVPAGVPHGSPKGNVQVPGVYGSPGGGEPGDTQGEHRGGQTPLDGRLAKRKLTRKEKLARFTKTCDICGGRFQVGKNERWKGTCAECVSAMRDAPITCPGCNRKFKRSRTELVSITVTPSKKGGKKYKIRYCQLCIPNVRMRSDKLEKGQAAELGRAKSAQQQFMRDARGR